MTLSLRFGIAAARNKTIMAKKVKEPEVGKISERIKNDSKTVQKNIELSKKAREASKMKEYLKREKVALEKIKKASGVDGPKGVGNPVKIEGRGSTGRTKPDNLNEQMAMHQLQSNPMKGAKELPIKMTDKRWPSEDGWVKMQNVVTLEDGTKVNAHFVYNKITGQFDDFKFK